MEWSPIRMTYHVRTYRFGERLIPELLGKAGVPDGVVAETWEISDQKDARATITSPPFAGRLLHDVVAEYPDEIVGQGWRGPHFPILDKFLDASHPLPVHLHADDETARVVHGEPNGKSEAWHIIYAAPDASILAGIRPGFSGDELRQAFLDEDYDRVMFRYPIAAGDTVYVPGGILHAFGPDTLIFEVQQTSDLGQSVMPTDLYGNRLSDAAVARQHRRDAGRAEDRLPAAAESRPGQAGAGAGEPHHRRLRWPLLRARALAPHGAAPRPRAPLALPHPLQRRRSR